MILKFTAVAPPDAPKKFHHAPYYLDVKLWGGWSQTLERNMNIVRQVILTAYGPTVVEESLEELLDMWRESHPEDDAKVILAPERAPESIDAPRIALA